VTEAGAGLRALSHRDRCAHLVGDGGGDVLGAGLVGLDDLLEQRDALLARRDREGLERLARCGDRLVDVGLGADGHIVHRLFGGRIDHGNRLHDSRVDLGAVDIEFHAIEHFPSLP